VHRCVSWIDEPVELAATPSGDEIETDPKDLRHSAQ
jgi:hypothetical protein